MKPVIQVQGVGKKYRIGVNRGYLSLREQLTSKTKSMLNALVAGNGKSDSDKGEFWSLRDVSFDVNEGEIVGIIGRNGAGKSTLLKILSKITPPTTGKVLLHGRVASLLEVGTGFHPELTGRENIYLNGTILGMTRAEVRSKFDEIVAFSEVETFLDTPVKRYSSGMYVRLAFAVAAHLEPEILLVDEVLAVGDAEFQKKCLGKMGEVAHAGRTVLFVSHNMAAVKNLCGRTIWFEKGAVGDSGETDGVIARYLASTGKMKSELAHVAPLSARVALRSVWITTEDGEASSALEVTRAFYVNIGFDVRERVSDVDIGVWLSNVHGVPVCYTNLSELNEGKIMPFDPGEYRASFKVPALFLVPDGYRLMAKAHVPNIATEDHIPEAGEFSVVETGSALSRYRHSWRYGVVLGNFVWTLSGSPRSG